MSLSDKDLSPEAQRLVELTGLQSYGEINKDVDLAAILREHPELMAGLDEYMKERDAAMIAADEKEEKQPVGHEIREELKRLGTRK